MTKQQIIKPAAKPKAKPASKCNTPKVLNTIKDVKSTPVIKATLVGKAVTKLPGKETTKDKQVEKPSAGIKENNTLKDLLLEIRNVAL